MHWEAEGFSPPRLEKGKIALRKNAEYTLYIHDINFLFKTTICVITFDTHRRITLGHQTCWSSHTDFYHSFTFKNGEKTKMVHDMVSYYNNIITITILI